MVNEVHVSYNSTPVRFQVACVKGLITYYLIRALLYYGMSTLLSTSGGTALITILKQDRQW